MIPISGAGFFPLFRVTPTPPHLLPSLSGHFQKMSHGSLVRSSTYHARKEKKHEENSTEERAELLTIQTFFPILTLVELDRFELHFSGFSKWLLKTKRQEVRNNSNFRPSNTFTRSRSMSRTKVLVPTLAPCAAASPKGNPRPPPPRKRVELAAAVA